MLRAFLFLFTILSAAVSGMLFWQWEAYSEKIEQSEEIKEKALQHLTVESQSRELKISQTIEGLTDGKEYRISVPESIANWSCVTKEANPCQSTDDNPDTFLAKAGSITLEYSLPVDDGAASVFLDDWTIKFPGVAASSTKLDIVDSVRRNGSWIAGAPLKGQQKLEFIDYYAFEGEGEAFSLYWQAQPLAAIDQGGISYYREQTQQGAPLQLKSLAKIADFPHLSIVMTDQYPETMGKGLLITKKAEPIETVERKAAHIYFSQKFRTLSPEENGLIDLFAAAITQQQSSSAKGQAMLNELMAKLTDAQLNLFFSAVKEEPEVTTKNLDELLGAAKGMGTHFFTLNRVDSAAFVPLYFYDSRVIRAANKQVDGIEIIYQDGKKLFPFMEIMTEMGYEANALADQGELLLNKGSNSYRFFADRNIFIYNEQDYGLLENPLITIDNRVYIEQQWLETLFSFSIAENEQEISISELKE
ncbi:hypothetical protein CVD25_12755 [Bacillus canaveralius]|uniref:Copper amine oxidase-like N-terminal domain-containing protein n=1 Tax=Bacillus canaveralius TaxID=1403243 RepID=A0A2N5GNL4_9BACI|nr:MULTISPECIES: stalk domain-containing protein [Bacillus]PLR84093.1 hypothetical protein CU635_07250 [Bacillus canaveralius]PLR87326.1 hypothetical protein CVD23_03725 [Bacillus sp. V33-4]PLR96261.1 hypothetical protein CVD25_12755 [Bacillus canaveralius]RSK53554.1 hypothetical protein EJA13_08255 [Bacillus canaveralius]